MLAHVIVNVIRYEKIDKYFDIKSCSSEKRFIGKLVLECEDEISNTTEPSLNNEKVTCEKN